MLILRISLKKSFFGKGKSVKGDGIVREDGMGHWKASNNETTNVCGSLLSKVELWSSSSSIGILNYDIVLPSLESHLHSKGLCFHATIKVYLV